MLRSGNREGYVHCKHLTQGKNRIAQRLMNKFFLYIFFTWSLSGDSFILKSIKGLGIPTKNNANIIDIANEIIHKKKANNEKITEFLQKLVISVKKRDLLEKPSL